MHDWLVVGAGFAGSVLAERIATERNERVLVIDKRPHIAGNAFDHRDAAGVLIHRYGPHIFHTNAQVVVDYLSRFTGWRPYEHRVLAHVDGKLVPIPINLTTINSLYHLDLTPEGMEDFLNNRKVAIDEIRTSEDVVLSTVGQELYEKFFRGYTRKQWGLDPSQLDKQVTARIPTRTNTDDRYFTDTFQAMPDRGYTAMFERMLDHPNITVSLSTSYDDAIRQHRFKRIVYTGPIDEFFDFRLGKLPYRSLRFVHRTIDTEHFQPVAVVNYPQTEDFTRITEYKHLTGQTAPVTSVSYEYPSATGDPYYPIPNDANAALFRAYQSLAATRPDVTFVGRLASYRYYNMDQVVAQALATFDRMQSADPRMARVNPQPRPQAAELPTRRAVS
jgi:UDP-galactopyranose mutase